MVLASLSSLSSRSRNFASALPCEKSPIESHPVSTPRYCIIRLLLFRSAPRLHCCTHPFFQSHSAKRTIIAHFSLPPSSSHSPCRHRFFSLLVAPPFPRPSTP